jgi:hypothetical protein
MVRIQNIGTYIIAETKTSDTGAYAFTHLQPSTYTLAVSQAGFKTFTNPSLNLVVGDPVRVDIAIR